MREWYHREFDNKNWELQNVLDNSAIGATIAHIRGANAMAITGAVNSFPNVPLGLAGADIIPARNVAEDWTIAGGRPTNAVPVVPNAGGGIPIILAGIRSGQRLHRIKKEFPSAIKFLRMLEIGTLKQGTHESVTSFWAKIQKYGDQLGYTPAQKKTSFISGVRHDILNNIFTIGRHKPINDILNSLEEIELRREVIGLPPSYLNYTLAPSAIPNIAPQQQGISLEDMQKAIQNALAQQKTEYQSLLEKQKSDFQSQMAQQSKKTPPPIPPKNMEQLYESNNPFDGTPVPHKPDKLRSARIDRLESIVGKVADTVGSVADSVGQLSNQLERMSLNDQSRKPFYCSNCGQEGHKKNDCPRLNPVAKSNFTQRYYPQLSPTQSQYTPPDSDNEEDGHDKVENAWYYTPEKKNNYH